MTHGWVPCPYCRGRRCQYCNWCGYVQGSSGIPGVTDEMLFDEDIERVDEHEVDPEYATDEIMAEPLGLEPTTYNLFPKTAPGPL
ncbi:hypothetical protein TWF694_004670 [Orbilia ellipsospora]|uniref:Uncharacterized protein n=1 Tax=Orbilia ellipsospora TaxID=2528407 RepID=A0AAV9WVY1_9PEZI